MAGLGQTGCCGLQGKHSLPASSPEAPTRGHPQAQGATLPLIILVEPSKRSSQPFRRFTSDSMPELVPAAKVVRSETQVGHRFHSDRPSWCSGREGTTVPTAVRRSNPGTWQSRPLWGWGSRPLAESSPRTVAELPPHLSPRGWGLQVLEAGREVLCPLPGQLPPEGGPPHPSRGR